MSKIRLRISHAALVAVATATFQGGYSYFSSAGSIFNWRSAATAIFTGCMTGLFGYLLSQEKAASTS